VLVVTLINPAFLSAQNVRDLLIKSAPVAIIACGMTFVIVTAEIDISVGSLMGLLAAVLGILTSETRLHLPVAVAIPLVLLLGTGLGTLNGLLVTVGRIPSIIVTLGMLTLLRGVTEITMGGEWIQNLPTDLRFWGTGNLLGIPVPALVAGVVFLLCLLMAQQTALGRQLYAVGGNCDAARLLGLSVSLLKWFPFALVGLLTGVATVVSVPQLSVIESGVGQGLELLVVTCVVVGGTALQGGRGTLTGTLLAVFLMTMVGTALIFLKLGEASAYWERAIQGAFILLAVLADHSAKQVRQKAISGRAA
jgi:ribose/xylose/arabinose/galactoside ABC-type transport system permease subunit